MPVKPVFRKDVGGTLTFDVPEVGAITGTPTCSVYQPGDSPTSPTATPTVTTASAGSSTTAGQLTAPITAGVCDTLGGTYRAEWSYTCGGTARLTNQVFGVVRSIVRPTMNAPKLLKKYPLIASRNTTSTTNAEFLDEEWGTVHDLLRQRGIDPDRIVDAKPLESAHAAFTAGAIARNLAAGNPSTSDWQARAELWTEEGRAALDRACSSLWWYDASQDLIPGNPEGTGNGDDEEDADLDQIEISR